MRTTVTIDPDVEALLQRAMKQKGLSFKEALNSALRLGLMHGEPKRARRTPLPRFDLRVRSSLNLDKAAGLAAALEDDEQVRKLERGS